MVENCYILYSCDGTYEPIISNFSGLSAYSSSFVTIEVLSEQTCVYVLSLGEIECDPTYDIDIVSGETCDCQCYCYFIRSADQTSDVTYVNCDNEIVVDTIQQGLTYNICSKVFPQFDNQVQIPIKLTDICENNQCPPTIPTVKPTNECDVITIFPMGVNCITQQPSSERDFDGAVELVVTGGTPPYTIFWEIGSFAPALTNLGIGEYSASVTDYYGDFSAFTTCVLTAETITYSGMCFVLTGVVEDQLVYITSEVKGFKNTYPYYEIQYGVNLLGYVFWNPDSNEWFFCETLECQITPYNTLVSSGYLYPTGTTGDWQVVSDTPYLIVESTIGSCSPPIIPKEETPLCATIVFRSSRPGSSTITSQVQLDPSVDINGQPSWSSSTGQYVVYWNSGSTPAQWVMTGFTNPSTLVANNDPSYPPVSNWQVYGSPEVYSVDIAQGECLDSYIVIASATVNKALCGNNGNITVSASGGDAPYQYSINGGLSYQPSPIFNNVLPGTYSIFVQDVNTTIGSFGPVVVSNIPVTIYNITMNVNYNNNTFTLTAPSLPVGSTITLDVVMSSTFNYFPQTLVTIPTYNNFTTINGVGLMTNTNTTANTYPLGGPCSVPGPVNVTQISNTYLNTLTLTSGQVVSGSTTNSIINPPILPCSNSTGYYQLSITNATINNCQCCQANLINSVPPVPQSVL